VAKKKSTEHPSMEAVKFWNETIDIHRERKHKAPRAGECHAAICVQRNKEFDEKGWHKLLEPSAMVGFDFSLLDIPDPRRRKNDKESVPATKSKTSA
jgi:hypothetical protein